MAEEIEKDYKRAKETKKQEKRKKSKEVTSDLCSSYKHNKYYLQPPILHIPLIKTF